MGDQQALIGEVFSIEGASSCNLYSGALRFLTKTASLASVEYPLSPLLCVRWEVGIIQECWICTESYHLQSEEYHRKENVKNKTPGTVRKYGNM